MLVRDGAGDWGRDAINLMIVIGRFFAQNINNSWWKCAFIARSQLNSIPIINVSAKCQQKAEAHSQEHNALKAKPITFSIISKQTLTFHSEHANRTNATAKKMWRRRWEEKRIQTTNKSEKLVSEIGSRQNSKRREEKMWRKKFAERGLATARS